MFPRFHRYLGTGAGRRPVTRLQRQGWLICLAVWSVAWSATLVRAEVELPSLQVRDTLIRPVTESGLAGPVSVAEVPFSVTRLAADGLETRQPRDIADMADYAAGASRRSNYWGLNTPTFQLRGFNAGDASAYYRDGFRYQARGPMAMANVESIEILRGPQSALYGWAEPGGVVQVQVKQPTAQPIRTFTAQVDNWGRRTVGADLGGALDGGGRFRLVASREEGGSFRDRQSVAQTLLAPSYAEDFAGGRQLSLALEWLDDKRTTDYGIPAINGKPAAIPLSRVFTESWGQQHSQSLRLTARWRQPLWDGQLSLAWSFYRLKYLQYRDVEPWSVTGSTVNRWYEDYPEQYRWTTAYADWTKRFSQGDIHHRFALRAEWSRELRSLQRGVLDDYVSINAYQPVYGQSWTPTADYSVYDQSWSNQSLGLAVQHEVQRGNWSLLMGLRWHHLRQVFEYADYLPTPGGMHRDQTDSAVTPRLGLKWQASDSTAFYTNTAWGKMPVLPQSRAFDGSTFRPLESRQWEAGIKIQPEFARWLGTVAFFDIERSNVLTRDPDHPAFSIQTGRQRSRGVELEWQGELTPVWKLLAQATWLDTRIEQDNRYRAGNGLPYAPRFSASLWLSRILSSPADSGKWIASGGLVHQGERFADFANTTRVPAYTRLDLGLSYQERAWATTLTLENALDQRYYQSGVENRPAVIYPGAPRTLMVRLKFMQ